jgi:hypothetical protein
LQWLHLLDRRVEVLLKKILENVHEECRGSLLTKSRSNNHARKSRSPIRLLRLTHEIPHKDIIEERGRTAGASSSKTSSVEGAHS